MSIVNRKSNIRIKLLVGASIAVLAPHAALAADATVVDGYSNDRTDLSVVTTAFQTVQSYPLNTSRTTAVVTASGGITVTNTYDHEAAASTSSVTTNILAATAIGNTFTNTAPLTVLDSAGALDGLSVSGVSINTGYATSLVEGSSLTVSLTDMPFDTSTNSSNSITASTTLNRGVTSVGVTTGTGEVPVNYSSTTGGSGFIDQFAASESAGPVDENIVNSSGSIVLSTLQRAEQYWDVSATDSWARVANNNVILDLLATTPLTMTGSGTLDDNVVAATFTGNNASSALAIEGGSNPTFTGSAVITTSQNYAGNDRGGSPDANAYNNSTSIRARVYANESDNYTLSGSLTVDGNEISATATGNSSLNNTLTLKGGINLAGATSTANAQLDDTGGQQDTTATGSLVVVSNQLNHNLSTNGGASSIVASSYEAQIEGFVQDLIGGSLSVSNNSISTLAQGNIYSGTIATSQNVTSFDGAVTFGTMQSSEEATIAAYTSESNIEASAGYGATEGYVRNSTISVLNNLIGASAFGNNSQHQIVLEATSLNTGFTGVAQLYATNEGFASGTGSVILASQQTSYDASVLAENASGSLIRAESRDYEGTGNSTVTVGGNQQEAIAVSNLTDNLIDLTATTIGGGIGLVNNQIVGYNSGVTATFNGSANVWLAEDAGESGASTISLIDNTQRAIAYGNSAGNALNVTATTSTAAANGSDASHLDRAATAYNEANGDYSLLSTQITLSNVTATVAPNNSSWSQFEVYVGEDVQDGSAVFNDRNDAIAAAYGNQVDNSLALSLNSISIGGDAPIANVSSGQYYDNEATVSAQARPNGDASILTWIGDDVWDNSSVSTSNNSIQAQVLGNTGSNSLDLSATQVSATNGDTEANDGGNLLSQVAVNSAQAADWGTTFRATLRDSFGNAPTDSASILTHVSTNVEYSSVTSVLNTLSASAGANHVVNDLTVTATGYQATTGVNSNQYTRGDTIATIGVEGTEATAGATSTYLGSGTTTVGGSANYQTFYNGTTTLTVQDGEDVSLFQGTMAASEWNALVAYMTANGWAHVAPNELVTTGNGNYDVSFFTGFGYTNGIGNGHASYTGFSIPGSAGNPNAGGITIEVGGNMHSATVKVDSNTVKGRAIGNDATNSLTVDATTLTQSSNRTSTHTHDWDNEADLSVSNWQDAYAESSSTATVISTYAVDQAFQYVIDNSLVSVSGNKQTATAVANLSDNLLTVSATDLSSSPVTIGLASTQEANNPTVEATSIAQIYAPIQSSGSTITMNDNSNRAVAVFNDATNTVDVTGTNVGSRKDDNATGYGLGSSISADVALNNTQQASGTLNATAETHAYNQDMIQTATTGLVNGTAQINGNVTLAEATANRSDNSATVNGSANQGAASGLGNLQDSSAVVTATATTNATLTLAGTDAATDLEALNASSASVSNNTTQALARGNSAINALTSAAGANYTPLAGATTAGSTNRDVAASAYVQNDQRNSGAVSAYATNVTYSTVLNSAGGALSATNSTVAVSGNTAQAVAYGNQASNQLTLTPLNSGLATGAINNYQSNTGFVRAEATSVTFSFTASSGTNSGSTFGVRGNGITATAVGNSVTSTIVGAR